MSIQLIEAEEFGLSEPIPALKPNSADNLKTTSTKTSCSLSIRRVVIRQPQKLHEVITETKFLASAQQEKRSLCQNSGNTSKVSGTSWRV